LPGSGGLGVAELFNREWHALAQVGDCFADVGQVLKGNFKKPTGDLVHGGSIPNCSTRFHHRFCGITSG
jgi:hypothetical protein